MVIPLPMGALPDGPPSQEALNYRPWIIANLILQGLYGIGTLILLGAMQTFHAIITLVCVAIGAYGVSDNMNIRWIMFWAFFGIMGSISSIAQFINAFLRSDGGGWSMFQSGEAWLVCTALTVFVGPLANIAPMYFACKLMSMGSGSSTYDNEPYGGRAYYNERSSLAGNERSSRPPRSVFSGQGNTLGS